MCGEYNPHINVIHKPVRISLLTKKPILLLSLTVLIIVALFIFKTYHEVSKPTNIDTKSVTPIPDPTLQSAVVANELILHRNISSQEVLSLFSELQSLISEYFITEARFPESLNDLGLDENSYDFGKLITSVQFSAPREYTINLNPDIFGEGGFIIYVASDMGNMGVSWSCSSNLETHTLSRWCKPTSKITNP